MVGLDGHEPHGTIRKKITTKQIQVKWILILVHYNPYKTGQYNPLWPPNQPGFLSLLK